MKHLIIYCHPNPNSFNHAILETYAGELKKAEEEVRIRDLYQLNFDPNLKVADFDNLAKNLAAEDITAEQENIKWAEIITFIFPIWWSGMPARLKGYIDRVFSFGFAYRINAEGPKGLLNGKKVILINTTGASKEMNEESGITQCLKQTIAEGIFGFCGMKVIKQQYFASVPYVSDQVRKAMLEELKTLVPETLDTL